ncbi:hypothetical protein ACIBCH_20775 [Amycolatopsis thailandensis]|uniref:hypothetical protein n=1 Tax=Amycolatopsis thailandensis TaxID=589330 RepID=UPI00379A11C4
MADQKTCPRGCVDTDPDGDCQASIAIPCPLGNWQEPEPYHVSAGICRDCHAPLDSCYCGEE